MKEQLLAILRHRENCRSLVMVSEPELLEALQCTEPDLRAGLAGLQAERAFEILAPLPHLVLAFLPRPWSDKKPGDHRLPLQFPNDSPELYESGPVSSAAAAVKQQEDEGLGEGGALLNEVLDILGSDARREEFQAILSAHDPALIRRALARVLATKTIRVSRTALFRSLLRKLHS